MELAKWKRRSYVPAWGNNREDEKPCSISYQPPAVGWMSKWRELALQAPMIARQAREAIENGGEVPVVWEDGMSVFREELLRDLITGVDNLYDGDGLMGTDKALDFIIENPGLRDEVFQAILAEGQVTTEQGKD